MLSMRLARISFTILAGLLSLSLNTLSITLSSVVVVSRPQKETQSLATRPAPMTSLPRLTVPATRGTCSRLDSSSRSSTLVCRRRQGEQGREGREGWANCGVVLKHAACWRAEMHLYGKLQWSLGVWHCFAPYRLRVEPAGFPPAVPRCRPGW